MNARESAFAVLLKLEKDASYLNLAEKEFFNKLEGSERSFANLIVQTVLEHKITLDYILSAFITKKKLDVEIITALRIGLAQVMYLNIRKSTAVDESVKLINKTGKKVLSGFVNAVLRNASDKWMNVELPPESEKTKQLSVKYSYPEWLVSLLLKQYDDAEVLMAYHREYRGINVRICDTNINTKLENSKYHKNSGIYMSHNLDKSEDYIKGRITPQSESSMFCVEAADIKPGMKVLDLCAAPGGKSAYAYEFKPLEIISCDLYENRVELIRKNFKRLNINESIAKPLVNDATVLREDFIEAFDVVIVDAPCSSLGLMYRKPDIKYSKSNEALRDIIATQRKILDVASNYVKSGGALIYSTCSINKKENSVNIKKFLENHDDYKLEGFKNELLKSFDKENTGEIQFLPHIHSLDGFYIARLIRT